VIREALRLKGWLSTTPAEFQDAVLPRGDTLRLDAGATLYHAGDEPGGIYGLITGHIELHLSGRGKSATLAHIAGPGFWVGDFAAIAGAPRRFTIVARDKCSLFRLSRAEMLRICTEEPPHWQFFAQLTVAGLGLAIDIAEMLRRIDSTARVASMLHILVEEDVHGRQVVLASQSDLAAMSRLSRGAVNIALAALEKRGWVTRGYGAINVTDPSALLDFVRNN
jgi:CRP/FNR family cyclic AMP-dependent transcriptional regulator